jgi:hypothetical protein
MLNWHGDATPPSFVVNKMRSMQRNLIDKKRPRQEALELLAT